MRRSKVEKESDFISFIFYVHKNAVHHNYNAKIGDWKYDAYQALISKMPAKFLRKEVLEAYGGREEFIEFHKQSPYQTYKVFKTL
jgi:hypothetical protein